jgi:hypothetical protein
VEGRGLCEPCVAACSVAARGAAGGSRAGATPPIQSGFWLRPGHVQSGDWRSVSAGGERGRRLAAGRLARHWISLHAALHSLEGFGPGRPVHRRRLPRCHRRPDPAAAASAVCTAGQMELPHAQGRRGAGRFRRRPRLGSPRRRSRHGRRRVPEPIDGHRVSRPAGGRRVAHEARAVARKRAELLRVAATGPAGAAELCALRVAPSRRSTRCSR